jgi:tetratricopeptide (TPR) repeat protein
MNNLHAIVIAAGLVTLGASASANDCPKSETKDSPLVSYVMQLPQAETTDDVGGPSRRLKAALYEMDRHRPPPGAECSHTLGASRFSSQYVQVAAAREELGELDAAMEATNAAIACTPRDASLYATVAHLHLLQGRVDDARAALMRGAAIDADDRDIDVMRARVDFLQERWADAAARFRVVMTSEEGLHPYWQLFYWLSQRRAGDCTPELPPQSKLRDTDTEDDAREKPDWPAPILATLKGEMTEQQLVDLIGESKWGPDRRPWLTEALYYVGELRLAEGDPELARRYFAAVVILKISDYVEYGMARAELARLRGD